MSNGIFPSLVRGPYPSPSISVYDVKYDLSRIATFCSQHDLNILQFLKTIWSVVLRQYAEKDILCFGFADVCAPNLIVGTDVEVIHATVENNTDLRALLMSQGMSSAEFITDNKESNYNTMLLMSGCNEEIDARELLQRDIFSHLVGLAERARQYP